MKCIRSCHEEQIGYKINKAAQREEYRVQLNSENVLGAYETILEEPQGLWRCWGPANPMQCLSPFSDFCLQEELVNPLPIVSASFGPRRTSLDLCLDS